MCNFKAKRISNKIGLNITIPRYIIIKIIKIVINRYFKTVRDQILKYEGKM